MLLSWVRFILLSMSRLVKVKGTVILCINISIFRLMFGLANRFYYSCSSRSIFSLSILSPWMLNLCLMQEDLLLILTEGTSDPALFLKLYLPRLTLKFLMKGLWQGLLGLWLLLLGLIEVFFFGLRDYLCKPIHGLVLFYSLRSKLG